MKIDATKDEMKKDFAVAYRELVRSLSDFQVVQIAACNAGIAYFPEIGKAFFSYEWGGGHWSHHVSSGWTDQYGPAVIGGTAAVIPDAYRDLDLERMQSYDAEDSDSDKTEFEKKMADPAWVAEIAAAWRAEMLSPYVIRDEVEVAVDRWVEILEQLASSET
ncbi:hypothetical protein LJ655_08265 [Paraburkholderia sp. MMS20-SJTN17]|uniref:DUF4303 domain-containing protein n=1 Tax=Paraburkholderia translucens TaxID=2886945 RepID=A0ABS8KAU0_9BURK|nr:hypothetical protein [Paraburkholderia sp. MMS20-SJTN17]MCC8401885.1 hypothetical protein [Paraburkholderia sp. MMS20-SJTN17]